jgi:uncharacterized membrane protein
MTHISEQLEIDVPVRVAYDQWTQFESFPNFMAGVEQVKQIDDKTLEWSAEIAGRHTTWRAEILEQRPDELVRWRSIEGARNDGVVRFDKLGGNRTRVTLELDVEPDGPLETAGAALGIVERRVKGDLERFRTFITERGAPTGAWRGSVDDGRAG